MTLKYAHIILSPFHSSQSSSSVRVPSSPPVPVSFCCIVTMIMKCQMFPRKAAWVNSHGARLWAEFPEGQMTAVPFPSHWKSGTRTGCTQNTRQMYICPWAGSRPEDRPRLCAWTFSEVVKLTNLFHFKRKKNVTKSKMNTNSKELWNVHF